MGEAAAQAFVFLLGGFDTSSTTLQACLFELAAHPETQEKLREEVNKLMDKNGKVSYENLHEKMVYMDQVINGRNQ